MDQRPIGDQGLEISAQGLGCMGMSMAYGPGDDQESTATIHRALEIGVTLLDTAEMYGPHTNERLVGKAIEDRRDSAQVATKFGIRRDESMKLIVDGTPANVRTCCDGSLQRLGIDHIDLYYLHRVDPNVPIEETVGAMGELVEQGKIRFVGLSEAAPETLRRANAVHPITALQSEYSLWSRAPEEELLATCRALEIGFVAYSPLGRGFLTGKVRSVEQLAEDDFRRFVPRFQGDNLAANVEIVERLDQLAADRGVSAAQLALAWVHAQGDDVFPIPGTKRRTYLEENAAAAEITLTAEDLTALEEAASNVRGERYEESGMASVDR